MWVWVWVQVQLLGTNASSSTTPYLPTYVLNVSTCSWVYVWWEDGQLNFTYYCMHEKLSREIEIYTWWIPVFQKFTILLLAAETSKIKYYFASEAFHFFMWCKHAIDPAGGQGTTFPLRLPPRHRIGRCLFLVDERAAWEAEILFCDLAVAQPRVGYCRLVCCKCWPLH